MKNTYFLIVIFLGLITISFAQDDPETRFLFKNLWPSITEHDSIVYSTDTGAAFIPEYITEFTFFSDGNIDTATSYDPDMPDASYSGRQHGNQTDIAYIDLAGGSGDTLALYTIIKDQDSRDSAMQVYYSNDTDDSLFLEFEYRVIYNSNNTVSKLEAFASDLVTKDSEYKFYYSGSRVDSMEIIGYLFGLPIPVTVLINNYDTGNKLLSTDIMALNPFEGGRTLDSRAQFMHNSSNEITQVYISYYDSTSTKWVIDETWKYLKKDNSTALPENPVEISIYPNPARDVLHVQGAKGIDSYEIIQINGNIVQKGKFSSDINIDRLPYGLYILKLSGEKETQTIKIRKI